MVDDLQDLDYAERGSQVPEGGVLVGVDLARATGRLVLRRVVASGAEVQVHPAALPLDLVDLALAVFFAARLERQDLQIPGEALEVG
jgi:hypothetical protein